MFDFVVEDTQEKPTVTFMREEPYLQYVSDLVHGTAWNSGFSTGCRAHGSCLGWL